MNFTRLELSIAHGVTAELPVDRDAKVRQPEFRPADLRFIGGTSTGC
jgi:hypothetical protein